MIFKFIGFAIDLLRELASEMQFTYTLYHVPDNAYGINISGQGWNGMIGELVNKVEKF